MDGWVVWLDRLAACRVCRHGDWKILGSGVSGMDAQILLNK